MDSWSHVSGSCAASSNSSGAICLFDQDGGLILAQQVAVVNEGCEICAELMRRCLEAIDAHLHARSEAAEATMANSGHDLDQHAERITQLRDAKVHAMDAYQAHLIEHRASRSASAQP